ncbi:hypothetical protein OPV22_018579 [Ensete ventricosum]|uniref:C2H2-type domain-containing protein n=1 Tax=Ensete ventricosum TaxID=4639 RepID=A0AAV8R0I5_ENSVE|nr:hypothetical protein OPV22_018579 [Ensete ventricosum]RWV87884.1 hypothetical protein GW17_00050079 [Ensete ventricosum]RZS12310.1 hypothetical protein BHM03_00043729 [Ensete ventricosum]
MLARAKARAYAKGREAERAAAADAKRKGPTATADDALGSKKGQVYGCNRCGEEFRSFQALGGHRKLKLLSAWQTIGRRPTGTVHSLQKSSSSLASSTILKPWTRGPALTCMRQRLTENLAGRRRRKRRLLSRKNENEEEDEDDRWVNAIIVDPEQQCPHRHVAAPEEDDDELHLTLHL